MSSVLCRSSRWWQAFVMLFACGFLVACNSGGSGGASVSSGAPQWQRPDIGLSSIESDGSGAGFLSNADFSSQLTDWYTCDYGTVATAESGNAVLNDENCIYQSVAVTPGQELTLACEARRLNGGDGWSGLGLSFYNASGEFISEPPAAEVSSQSFSTYTVTGTAPANAQSVGVWLYTTSGSSLNGCMLTAVDAELPGPPQATAEFCPVYEESPLFRPRANTIVLTPEDDNWEVAIELAPANTEIFLSPGEYLMDRETIYMANSDITVRSLSGNRDDVVIQGLGYYTGASEGFMVAADRITIADMTMHGMRRHAIAMKPGFDADGVLSDTYVYNMNIYDTGTQHVKGANTGENKDAVIACNTIGYTPGGVAGNYIGAVGIFEGTEVVVRDNYIYNITGDGSGCDIASPDDPCTYDSVPAIYMRDSRDSIIERNVVVDSWRGISLGLTNGHTGGIVRNNFVYRDGPGDHGISIELTTDAIVEHNTVIVGGYWAPMEIRAGSGHIFRNNLTTSPIQERDGTFNNSLTGNGNMVDATPADFVAPGDPHLQAGSAAIGAGVEPATVIDDIDGDIRQGRWDVGADQYTE